MTKKKGNGEGSVYPRKNRDGKVVGYRGAYFAWTSSGTKKRLYVSGKTKTEVNYKGAGSGLAPKRKSTQHNRR